VGVALPGVLPQAALCRHVGAKCALIAKWSPSEVKDQSKLSRKYFEVKLLTDNQFNSPKKLYLIYFKPYGGPVGGHAVIYTVNAASVEEAMQAYARDADPALIIHEDNSVQVGKVVYPHILALIEEGYKTYAEWQIREITPLALQEGVCELFCGDDEDTIVHAVGECKPLLKQIFPGVRPRAFLWHTENGTIVTFYRKKRRGRLEIVARICRDWHGPRAGEVYVWDRDYAALTVALRVRPVQPWLWDTP
jgi:hypothetical protein